MKNKFHLASLAMIVALVFSLISCSKDKIDPVGGSPSGRTASPAATNGIAGHEFQQYDHDAVTTGALIMQIMNGKVQPADADQQAMLNVINGEKAPETLVEKTWMKYLHVVRHPRRMINLGATMGDGGSEESFSEDFE